ncbi:unnamed protein product [Camellia sinensis]
MAMTMTHIDNDSSVVRVLSTQLNNPPITHPLEVAALQAIHGKLQDPLKNLRNWAKKDPCTSNWTGVICNVHSSDGYLHVQELRLLNKNLDFMWNDISGSIPKEIGNITSLHHLLLSGNQISGPLPDELGFLPNLIKFQLDRNYISGPLPKSFANLSNVKHFHMNNNSISGQIPYELSELLQLQHVVPSTRAFKNAKLEDSI